MAFDVYVRAHEVLPKMLDMVRGEGRVRGGSVRAAVGQGSESRAGGERRGER